MHRLATALLIALAAAAPAGAEPDLILINAKVFTSDAGRPAAEAFAVTDGRFSAVGRTAAVRRLAGPSTRIVDAGGRLVIPGLIDAHVHVDPPPPGRPIVSPGPILARVAAATQSGPGWLSGDISVAVFNDPKAGRTALDAVAPGNPVILTATPGHEILLNSRALEALGIDDRIEDPIGGRWGRDVAGRLTGQAYESAATLVARRAAAMDPNAALEAANMRRTADTYIRWGVTSVDLMAQEATLEGVRAALERARVPIRWTVYAWGLPQTAIEDAWREVDTAGGVWPALTRLGGSKWILDGSPLDRGAYLLEDYADQPGWRGRCDFTEVQLGEILGGALASSHQVALHTVGDGTAEMVLRVMEKLAPASQWREVRVRMEHGDGVYGDRIARTANLGIVIVQNPVHLGRFLVDGGQTYQEARWGARAAQFQQLKSLLAAGVRLGFGSDSSNAGPDANPFLNIRIASSDPLHPDEAITREEALIAYTAGSAYAERQEEIKGKIKPGLVADWAVLSQDILTAPLETLPATTSLLTVVGGSVVYADARQNLVAR
ncbi:MAG TPA: amidohydrolase [Steroidobacteraceae bacterium]|nr:amidohydrolase [Steroidobacteraceae bacterium]